MRMLDIASAVILDKNNPQKLQKREVTQSLKYFGNRMVRCLAVFSDAIKSEIIRPGPVTNFDLFDAMVDLILRGTAPTRVAQTIVHVMLHQSGEREERNVQVRVEAKRTKELLIVVIIELACSPAYNEVVPESLSSALLVGVQAAWKALIRFDTHGADHV